MRIVILLLGSLLLVSTAQAQNFGSTTYVPVNGSFNGTSQTGVPQVNDLVLVNKLIPGAGQVFSTAGLPLSAFASAADVQNLNARVDQAFQQFGNTTQLERGIAAAVALQGVSMPSAPGRTTWAINGAAFQSEIGAGISLAHRLNFSMPLAVTAAYGNGGGTAHVGRVGLMGEF